MFLVTAVQRPRNGVSIRPRARLPAERERSRFDRAARDRAKRAALSNRRPVELSGLTGTASR